MCLIVFDWRPNGPVPLRVAANRDETYARPTLSLHHWTSSAILGGRDQRSGGTWLAAAPGGRFAALTNVRDATGSTLASPPSRGGLVREALEVADPETWLRDLHDVRANDYAGFNLLVLHGTRLWHLHHGRDGNSLQRVAPGLHAVSNASLDTPWPKVRHACNAARAASPDRWHRVMRQAMRQARPADDGELPDTGIGITQERLLSPAFIASKRYGTRALTLVTLEANGKSTLEEQCFGPWGRPEGDPTILTTATSG